MARPLIMIALVDALGWEVVEKGLGRQWLGETLQHRRPLDTVLGFSSGAIPALISGTWPSENGRWLMYSRAGGSSPLASARLFSHLPGRFKQSYRVSRVLHSQIGRQVRGYFSLYNVPWNLLPQFDLAERKPLYAVGGLNGHPTWFDHFSERNYRVRVWDWRTPENENAEAFVEACGDDSPERADVLFWYTPGQDAIQHRLGTRAAEVHEHLQWLGDQIREGAMRAEAAGRPAWVYVFSDHGMTDVTQTVDLMGTVRDTVSNSSNGLGFVEGTDWLAFYDSTLARFWWLTDKARNDLRPAILKTLQETGAGSWMEEEELRRLNVLFEDRRYGEDIYLLNPGSLITPSYMGAKAVRGMHGYHPSEPTSRAVALSNRPLAEDMHHVVDVTRHLLRECEARDLCPVRS